MRFKDGEPRTVNHDNIKSGIVLGLYCVELQSAWCNINKTK